MKYRRISNGCTRRCLSLVVAAAVVWLAALQVARGEIERGGLLHAELFDAVAICRGLYTDQPDSVKLQEELRFSPIGDVRLNAEALALDGWQLSGAPVRDRTRNISLAHPRGAISLELKREPIRLQDRFCQRIPQRTAGIPPGTSWYRVYGPWDLAIVEPFGRVNGQFSAFVAHLDRSTMRSEVTFVDQNLYVEGRVELGFVPELLEMLGGILHGGYGLPQTEPSRITFVLDQQDKTVLGMMDPVVHAARLNWEPCSEYQTVVLPEEEVRVVEPACGQVFPFEQERVVLRGLLGPKAGVVEYVEVTDQTASTSYFTLDGETAFAVEFPLQVGRNEISVRGYRKSDHTASGLQTVFYFRQMFYRSAADSGGADTIDGRTRVGVAGVEQPRRTTQE